MLKILNIIILTLIFLFIFNVYNYYSSNKNINIKEFNRINIEKILEKKIINLPVLINDTNNVIKFNNSIENEINDNKKRSFWNLLRKQRKEKL